MNAQVELIEQDEFTMLFVIVNIHGQVEVFRRVIKFRQNELIEDFNVLRNTSKNLDQD